MEGSEVGACSDMFKKHQKCGMVKLDLMKDKIIRNEVKGKVQITHILLNTMHIKMLFLP